MFSKLSLQPLSRLAAVLSLAAVAALPAGAQEQAQATAQVQAQPVASSQSAMQNLELYSSSAVSQDGAVTNERESLSGSPAIGPNADADPQYGGGYGGPPRRRPYGRPTYKDRWTNTDGSSKVAFEAGVGPATAAGATGHYSRTGVDVSVGVGRNFSRAFGVLVQYDYAHMGVVNAAANNFVCGSPLSCSGISASGATHLWSLTLNPVITFANTQSQWGMYIVGGGGIYRKMTTFTVTDNFGDTYNCPGSSNGCRYSNNAIGANGGLGLTYKITQDSSAKVFAEARYTWVDNQPSASNTYANSFGNGSFYQTNQRTGYFPVTIGIRF